MLNTLFCSFMIFTFYASNGEASPIDRLESVRLDLGKVARLPKKVGMASLIEIPGPVDLVVPGNPGAITYTVPDLNKKNIIAIWLNSELPRATNVLIYSDHKVYAIDIIPSVTVNQDYLKILGGYGAPSYRSENQRIIATSASGKSK